MFLLYHAERGNEGIHNGLNGCLLSFRDFWVYELICECRDVMLTFETGRRGGRRKALRLYVQDYYLTNTTFCKTLVRLSLAERKYPPDAKPLKTNLTFSAWSRPEFK